jgi:hypothetical protein
MEGCDSGRQGYSLFAFNDQNLKSMNVIIYIHSFILFKLEKISLTTFDFSLLLQSWFHILISINLEYSSFIFFFFFFYLNTQL